MATRTSQKAKVEAFVIELVKISHNYNNVAEIPAYLIITAKEHVEQALANQNLNLQLLKGRALSGHQDSVINTPVLFPSIIDVPNDNVENDIEENNVSPTTSTTSVELNDEPVQPYNPRRGGQISVVKLTSTGQLQTLSTGSIHDFIDGIDNLNINDDKEKKEE